MRRFFLLISTLFFCKMLLAQVAFPEEVQSEIENPPILNELNLNQDSRLEKMLNWHIENNKKRDGITGYRIEIFFSSKLDAKEKALEKKVEFLSKYPDFNVHVIFFAPNFRVRVGDFRTKNEALKLFKEIEDDYPGAFIVKGIIDFPTEKPKIL